MELKAARRIKGCIKSIGKKIDNYKEVREKCGMKGVIYCIGMSFCNKVALVSLTIGEGILHFGAHFLDWGDMLLGKCRKEAYKKAMKKQRLKL